MTSVAKRNANRRNARRSTGPRTAEGKACAAQNARKVALPPPALSDLRMGRTIGKVARQLAGPTADAQRFAAACRLAAVQIDLLEIREARRRLLARALEDASAIGRLHTLDRHERYARTLRRRAVRNFGPARAASSSSAETSDEALDIAAVLRVSKAPAHRRRRTAPGTGRRKLVRGLSQELIRRGYATRSAILPNEANAKNPAKTMLQDEQRARRS